MRRFRMELAWNFSASTMNPAIASALSLTPLSRQFFPPAPKPESSCEAPG
jgi:hypothetical protein